MVRHVELKPPPELVDAIKASEDGSTAPPSADISSGPGGYSGNTPRTIRNKLEHEEFAAPSEAAAKEAEGGAEGGGALEGNRAMRTALDAEHTVGHKFAGKQYDRQHLQAGTQGRGAEAVHSKASIMNHNKGQSNKG